MSTRTGNPFKTCRCVSTQFYKLLGGLVKFRYRSDGRSAKFAGSCWKSRWHGRREDARPVGVAAGSLLSLLLIRDCLFFIFGEMCTQSVVLSGSAVLSISRTPKRRKGQRVVLLPPHAHIISTMRASRRVKMNILFLLGKQILLKMC